MPIRKHAHTPHTPPHTPSPKAKGDEPHPNHLEFVRMKEAKKAEKRSMEERFPESERERLRNLNLPLPTSRSKDSFDENLHFKLPDLKLGDDLADFGKWPVTDQKR